MQKFLMRIHRVASHNSKTTREYGTIFVNYCQSQLAKALLEVKNDKCPK